MQFLSVADRQLHSASPSQLLDTSVIALQASPRATVHADRVSKMGQVTCVQIVDALYANCTTPNLKICKHHRWWCWLGQIGMHSADRLVGGSWEPVPRCSNQLLLLSPSPSTFFATSCPAIHGGAYLSRLFVGENAIGYFFSRHTPLLGMPKKHQNWKFQYVTKICGYTSPGDPRTP